MNTESNLQVLELPAPELPDPELPDPELPTSVYPGPETLNPHSELEPLWESRPAVWCVLGFCVLLVVVSAIGFFTLLNYSDPAGRPYFEQPGSWSVMGGCLLRALIGIGLTCCLWRYLQILRRWECENPESPREFFQAISNWWTVLAYGLFLNFLYGFVVFVLVFLLLFFQILN